ncbi:hypothetical protein T4B_13843 [Trichinella pseudospiralis]|uniref:Uncharacterized protein n=1 Tax=Trichinella pseudospiralis TaxID=6337 RepID=A0A0V1GJN7_TRIPS|nr:hypothetical protein T4B_13843 [Trichinella pseudospiralis]
MCKGWQLKSCTAIVCDAKIVVSASSFYALGIRYVGRL